MPINRHTKSLDVRRSRRPGPILSAAESKIGRRARGNDGQMYVAKMNIRGVKRWVRASKPTSRLRKGYSIKSKRF